MTTPAAMSRRGLSELPALRTFRSRRFRMVIALCLIALGVVLYALSFALLRDGDPPWLYDFSAYLQAAERLVEGSPLYSAAQLAGPVDAVCEDCYLYPPPLAQALVPTTFLPPDVTKVAWFGLLQLLAFASTWLATGIGGAPRSLERLLWSVAATLLFIPIFHANYYGNVGSLIALLVTLVAMGGAAAGAAAALGMLIKVSPGGLAPAAIAQGSRSRRSFLATMVVVGGLSLLLAPQAWRDYATVLPQLLAGSSQYPFNLAPANVAFEVGLPDALISAVRALTLAAGVVCLAISVWLARRPGGMPAAALAGTAAMLIIPGTLWAHYLAVLLPFAAMAWPRAGSASRAVLLSGAVLVALTGLGETDGLPHLGSVLMLVGSGWVLWPRTERPA